MTFTLSLSRIATKQMELGFLARVFEWMDRASCFGMSKESSDVFFPKTRQQIDEMAWVPICMQCPVRVQCSNWGEEIDGEGVFGGDFRTFHLEENRQIPEDSGSTVAGNQPGWKLLERGHCKHKHEILTQADLHIRNRVRKGVAQSEAECYHCWKGTRNRVQGKRKKAKREASSTSRRSG